MKELHLLLVHFLLSKKSPPQYTVCKGAMILTFSCRHKGNINDEVDCGT